MHEPVIHAKKNENRKMLIWFLIALLIAILPWILIARETRPSDEVVNNSAQNQKEPCQRVCTMIPL
jgi:hypothetical protein